MPPLRTVLFDLDGTLIDSIQLIIDSYHHTLSAHGLPARTDKQWLDGIGTPLRVQFAEWAHDEAQMEAMIATYRDYNIFQSRPPRDRLPGRPGDGATPCAPRGAGPGSSPARTGWAPFGDCGWPDSRRPWMW